MFHKRHKYFHNLVQECALTMDVLTFTPYFITHFQMTRFSPAFQVANQKSMPAQSGKWLAVM